MKKQLAIVLAMLYTLLTVGINVSLHYCCGDIASVSFYSPATSCCGDDAGADSCCQDRVVVVHLDDQQALKARVELLQISGIAETILVEFVPTPNRGDALPAVGLKSEIHLPKEPAWLRYCSLVYYG